MIARNATLSIYGLYLLNTDLFDEFRCPAGLDRDTVIDSIVLECAELELLFPDPRYMKSSIGLWSMKEARVWDKIVDTLNLDYNPIWNKDGTYIEERAVDSTAKSANSSSSSSKDESTNVEQVSAYNDSDFANRSKNTGTGNMSSEGTTSGTSSGKTKEKLERREYGNIGVTTTQAMMTEEIELRKKNNPIDYIVKSFKARFCLLIY